MFQDIVPYAQFPFWPTSRRESIWRMMPSVLQRLLCRRQAFRPGVTRVYLGTDWKMAPLHRGQREQAQPVTTTVCLSSFSFSIRTGRCHMEEEQLQFTLLVIKDDSHLYTLKIYPSLQTRRRKPNSQDHAFHKHIAVVPFLCKLHKA